MIRAGQFAAMLAMLLLLACGDGSSTSTGSTGGQGASGGQGGQGGAGGGEGGNGGTGGMGGGAPIFGPPAGDFVNAGGVSKSSGHRLVWTLGQSTQNQSKMSSAKYRLQGGLVGAVGSLP